MKIHVFENEIEAYDASQCDERIQDGDVLVAIAEKATAVLIKAWPTTVVRGTAQELHQLRPEASWLETEGGRYAKSATEALLEAQVRGWV